MTLTLRFHTLVPLGYENIRVRVREKLISRIGKVCALLFQS
jgi:hypothetical protein